jgi:hypothetical protein
MDQKPTIGRIVWYQAHGSPNGEHKSEPRAAVVAAAPESETSDGDPRLYGIRYNDSGQPLEEAVIDHSMLLAREGSAHSL